MDLDRYTGRRGIAALLLAACLWTGTAAGQRTEAAAVRQPEAAQPAERTGYADAGTRRDSSAENGYARIRHEASDPGAVYVAWLGEPGLKIRAGVQRIDTDRAGDLYTYYIAADGSENRIALTEGSGRYRVSVYENIEGIRYRVRLTHEIDAEVADGGAAFLGSTVAVEYGGDSAVVRKAAELCAGAGTDTEKIRRVQQFVIDYMSYDTDKQSVIASGSWTGGTFPDVDAAYAAGRGVCYDYAGIMSAMLRSQGVPCIMVYGYVDGKYHAWCMALPDADGAVPGTTGAKAWQWLLVDPTLADGNPETVVRYVRAGKYQAARKY